MDSNQIGRSPPPRLEDLARRTARTLLLPYIISYASTHGLSDQPQEVAVIVNPRTGSMTMIDGGVDGTPLWGKEGRVPASKESIDAMPTIQVKEQGFDCAICLSEFQIGEEAKQMPCKHKYHPGCIDKWLGIQGSCPVCRYRMPVEGDEEEEKGSGDDGVDGEAEESEGEEEEEEEGEEEEEEEEAAEEGEGVLGLTSRIPTFVFHIYFAGRNRNSTNSGSGSGSRGRSDRSEPNESDGEEESGEEGNESGASESEEEETGGSSSEDMEVDSGSPPTEMDMDIDGQLTS